MKRKGSLTPPAASGSQPTKVRFDQEKEVRAIARERVGPVKPAQAILPKTSRKKPKHKKPLDAGGDSDS